MEDWEQFFAEKSRRADQDRRRDATRILQRLTLAAIVLAALLLLLSLRN